MRNLKVEIVKGGVIGGRRTGLQPYRLSSDVVALKRDKTIAGMLWGLRRGFNLMPTNEGRVIKLSNIVICKK